MVPIILLLSASRPDFAKMRQRNPLRNFLTFLAKKQAPIHVSAVSSSFARMSFASEWYLCATLPDHPQAGADEGGLVIANGHGDGRSYDEFAPIKGNGIGDAVGIVNSGYKATVGRGMLPALCSCWRDKQKAHCQGGQEG